MKPCPFCGSEPVERLSKIDGNVYYGCWNNLECPKAGWFTATEWNTRPIEDAFRVQLAARDALIERLVEVGNDIVEEAQVQEPDVQELRDNWRVLIAKWKAMKKESVE